MPSGYSVPALGKEPFSCPHCGAHAHQTWYWAGVDPCGKDTKPWVPDRNILEEMEQANHNPETKENLLSFFRKRLSKKPFTDKSEQWQTYLRLHNISLSCCFSCDQFAIWLYDSLLFPETHLEIALNEDTPVSVLPYLEEARNVYPSSARCAAAMLRLAMQQLCIELGEKGKNINDDIGSLVKKGLDARITKALDIVRIVGNGAVHPGEINFSDNDETVLELFKLIDVIITAMISQPKKIDALFEKLPEGPREATKKRDSE